LADGRIYKVSCCTETASCFASLTVTETGTIRKLRCGDLFASRSNYGSTVSLPPLSHRDSVKLCITHGHWNWYHSKASVRWPIRLPQ